MTERAEERPSASLARSSAAMASGTLVSRVLGLVRATLLASVIGTAGLTADAFQTANTLPNQFYLLIAGGILNAVLVPQITKAASHADGGEEFVNRLITLSLAFILTATVVCTALAPVLLRLFNSSDDVDALALGTVFAFICLPQIFFYGLYTLLGQVLNAGGRFAAYMWAPVLANLVAIGGLVLFRALGYPAAAAPAAWTPGMVWVLAGSATLSIAIQAVFLVVPLRRMGFRYRPRFGFRGVGLRSASRVAMWTFAAVAVSQLGFVVISRVLTEATQRGADEGVVAAGRASYDNAFLLFMLPHSLITVSLVTALFTRMSRAAHAGDTVEVVADLSRGMRMPAVLLVPVTVAGVVFGPLITRTFFFGNPPAQTQAVAGVMMAMFLGIVPYGWLYLVQRVYYAHEDARTPFGLQVLVTALAVTVTLLAATLDPTVTGIVVGLGQTVSNLAGALVGFVLLRRKLGPLRLGSAASMYARLAVASVLAGVLARLVLEAVAARATEGRLEGAVTLLSAGTGFVVLVLLLAHLLRVREVHELLAPALRRVGVRR